MEEKIPVSVTEEKRLAGLVADRLNDWLIDNHYDFLHEVCNDVVMEEHPNLSEDELWEILPEVFERVIPFTSN